MLLSVEPLSPRLSTLSRSLSLPTALASQIKSVYRHGTPRDCMPKFEDFKFCMSVKGLSEERKEEVWVRRRAEWWARRRLGKSSEDVWDARQCVQIPTTVPSRGKDVLTLCRLQGRLLRPARGEATSGRNSSGRPGARNDSLDLR